MEVYLDNSATTMCYPDVGELVYKVMCQDYGNPSSMHRKGVQAEHYMRDAKETIARLLKVNAKELIFTSGGKGEPAERESSDHDIDRASCYPEYNEVPGGGRGIPRDLSASG